MAGLFARLGAGYEQVALLRARLPGADLDEPVPNPAEAKPTPTAPKPKLHAALGAARGRLKNGNPAGDFLKAPRCGARTRAGCACRQPAMAKGRCRLHGGLSTGPRTPEGLARCRTTRLVHGCRSRTHLALRSRAVHAARRLRALARDLSPGLSAWHGVHRSKIANSRRGALRAPAYSVSSLPTNSCLTDPRARAARPHPNPPADGFSAGHGVHRSDSVNRRGAEAQSSRVTRSRPPAPSSSAPLRLCGEPLDRKGAHAAGHGVHRSFRDHLRSSASICGSPTFRPTSQLSAGHGVHRPDSPGVTTPAGLR